jgi:hypothetical protein
MAMFSRRILQRMLYENSVFLKKGQTKRFIETLNLVSNPSALKKDITLSSEWEVVLLNLFGKIGNVIYEEKFGGSTYGDIYFENPDVKFLAEVTTASDKGLNENNPIDFLWKELEQILRTHGLNPNHFSLEPDGEYYECGRNGTKVRLLLPARARFSSTIFTKKFEKFLQSILQSPENSSTFEINEKNIKLKIGYDPKQRFSSVGHPDYSAVFSLNRNIIYERLNDKRVQLQKTGFKGPMGIFLCDGDCRLLQESLLRKTSGSYTRDQIIRHFLNEDSTMSFVVIFLVEENPRPTLHTGPRRFHISARVHKGIGFQEEIWLDQIVEKARSNFPQPERDACNAIHLLRGRTPHLGSFFLGGHSLKLDKESIQIKISAREMLNLLTGKLSYDDFLRIHGFDKTANPFLTALENGQLIENVSIEKSDFQDDDWLIFNLKGPDPAVSKFTEPIQKSFKSRMGTYFR